MPETPKIAVPQPCTYDFAYTRRVLPDYVRAIEKAGGEAVLLNPRMSLEELTHQIASCSAVLLTSSHLDIDPEKYGAARELLTADPDPPREALDDLLLKDAFHWRKPLFGICYGLQALNVYQGGTLTQHVGDPHQRPHPLETDKPDSKLAKAVDPKNNVNSKHRQAVKRIGTGLSKVFSFEGVIEALEGDNPDHYVVGVQWHPERDDFKTNVDSRTIFEQFIQAALDYETKRKKDKEPRSSGVLRVGPLKTVADWQALLNDLQANKNRWQEAFEDYFYERLRAYYLDPIQLLRNEGPRQGEGFSIVTIQCSLIEFLESTWQGKNYICGIVNNKSEYNKSKRIFLDFLMTRIPFKEAFGKREDLAIGFYDNVRCGLLHEARTKGGWKILAKSTNSQFISFKEKTVYRDDLQDAIQKCTDNYREDLLASATTKRRFIQKFERFFG